MENLQQQQVVGVRCGIVTALTNTKAYPDPTDCVEVKETHISWVFLTDRFAYKLKKSVRFDFLDFSTVDLRREACKSEVELNRRLAPDVYLGVVPLTMTPDGVEVDGTGEVIDWLVKMRRLPANRSLDQLIRTGALSNADIQQVVRKLTDFYRQIPPVTMRPDEYRARIEDHVHDNYRTIVACNSLAADQLERVYSAQLRQLRVHADAFDDRVLDGRIVEGHGDLRPDHIYLNSAPVVIDCVEFNREFRELDVLDELGFLAVECAYLDAADVGRQFVEHYCAVSGDTPRPGLLPFYMGYRATVRCKVHVLRAQQLKDGDREQQLAIAEKYLRLAGHYASQSTKPLVIVVYGVSGTGKSTVALGLSESLGISLVQTDRLRQQILGASTEPFSVDANHYTPELRRLVYDRLFEEAAALLRNERSVILDGTFLEAELRARVQSLAREFGAEPIFFQCDCPAALAEQRIVERRQEDNVLSEAQPELVEEQLRRVQPDLIGVSSQMLDTTGSLPEIIRAAYSTIRGL